MLQNRDDKSKMSRITARNVDSRRSHEGRMGEWRHNFTFLFSSPVALHPTRETPYALNMKLCGSRSRNGHSGREKIPLALPGIERHSLGDPPTSLNPLPTTLSLVNRRTGQKKNWKRVIREGRF